MRARFRGIFLTRSRDEWMAVFEGTDACVAPVLSPSEAPLHPHNAARDNFQEVAGVMQAGPAPRFSRTEAVIQSPPPVPGEHSDEILAELGFGAAEVDALRQEGVVG